MGANFKNGGCEIQLLPAGDAVGLGNTARIYPTQYGSQADFVAAIGAASLSVAGVDGLWGPLGVSTYFDYRLRLDHFEDRPFPGEPTNGKAEVEAFEAAGFQVARRYRSHELKLDEKLTRRLRAVAAFSFGFAGPLPLTRESLNPDSLLANAERLYELTHEMFKTHFGYQAIGADVFKAELLARLVPVVCWKTSFVIRDERGLLIGYSLHLRDPNDPGRVCLKTFGIDPRIPNRARAFFSLLRLMNESLQGTYDRVVFCLISEGETTDRLAEKIGPLKSMTYGLFYKALR